MNKKHLFALVMIGLISIFGIESSLAQIPEHLRPSDVILEPDWMVEYNVSSDELGRTATTVGDVDQDGYDDVLVTAWHHNSGQTESGIAYLFYGSPDGLEDTPQVINPPYVDAYGFFGWPAGAAGDVNGDGYDDVIISLDNFDYAYSDEGAVYVYYGSASGLSTSYDWMARGASTWHHLGWSVGTAGDVNCDGYDDIIVGAYMYTPNNISHAYVWYGSPTGLDANGTRPVGLPANADWYAADPKYDDYGDAFGMRAGTAGDLNGDGCSEVYVGASLYDNGESNEGAVFVWYGSEDGLGDPGTIENFDWMAESNQIDGNLGSGQRNPLVAADYNADGYDDFLIGIAGFDAPDASEGIALLWYGSEEGLGDNGTPDNADWSAQADQAGAQLGIDAQSAGDINGDGIDDIVIGAYQYDVISDTETIVNAGQVMVWFGSQDGPGEQGSPDNANRIYPGNMMNGALGFEVGAAGDVNGDGLGDLVAGANFCDNPETDEGMAFAYYGFPDAIAGITATNDSPTILGQTTTFASEILSGTMVTYSWDFGDDASGLGEVISHTYAVPGIYTATVTATNKISSASADTVVIVEAAISGLSAANDGPTPFGQATHLVANLVTGSNVTFSWDFGDGQSEIGQKVVHIYRVPGSYTATVTASNNVSSDSATTKVVIKPTIYLPLIQK